MIIDTDVLIWDLRGNEKAREIVLNSVPFGISVITYMEVVQGMRNKRDLQIFIKQFRLSRNYIFHEKIAVKPYFKGV